MGRPGCQATVLKLTGELAELARKAVRQAQRVLGNARRRGKKARRKGRAAAAVKQLATDVERASRVVDQTTRRVTGQTSIPDRVISLGDVDLLPVVDAHLGGLLGDRLRRILSRSFRSTATPPPVILMGQHNRG